MFRLAHIAVRVAAVVLAARAYARLVDLEEAVGSVVTSTNDLLGRGDTVLVSLNLDGRKVAESIARGDGRP